MAATQTAPTPLQQLVARPRAMAVLGALAIAFSSILVREASVSPSTAAVFRCAYAVPILFLLARAEDRRLGPRPARDRRLAAIAGLFFAVDLVCWHHAIEDVGAGLATVLGNLQVAFVPVLAWLFIKEKPGARILLTLPLMLSGIVLISGALEQGAYGEHPTQGVVFGIATGLSYAGFILVLRQGGQDLRRPAGPAVRRDARRRPRRAGDRRGRRRPRPRAVLARARLARGPGADQPGRRLAADLRLAAAPARRADVASC